MHTQSRFRLLVVRLGAMGDILHALPAVTALRQAHPAWQIGWVVEPRWAPLLKAGVRDQGSGISEQWTVDSGQWTEKQGTEGLGDCGSAGLRV